MNEDDSTPEYTIDQLAAHTGVPSRTIRFYQSSGALHSPTKRGRIAYYGPDHAQRLALIDQLKNRGLRIRAIKDLVRGIERGEFVLEDWLGLEGELRSSWANDAPRVLGQREIETLVGERRADLLHELVRCHLVQAQEDGTYRVPSPGLLALALELEDDDIGLDVTVGMTARLRKHLERAAKEFADHLIKELGESSAGDDTVLRSTETIRRLRPIAQEWVRLIFAREMEQALRERLESGQATTSARKRRRKRKQAL